MIDEAELQRNLQSLACAKFKILKKHPPGRDVSPLDSFSFNHDFTSPMHRIKINTISSKVESFEQRKDTMDKVDEERKYQIDVRPILTELFCCLGMGFPGVYCASNERQKEVVAQ